MIEIGWIAFGALLFVLGAFCGVRGVLWMLTLGPRHSPNTYEEVRAAMKKGGGA